MKVQHFIIICLLSRKHIADSTHYNTLGAGWMREDHALHWGAAIGGACAGLGEGAHICSLLGELVWSIAGNYGVHYASSSASYPMSFSTAAFAWATSWILAASLEPTTSWAANHVLFLAFVAHGFITWFDWPTLLLLSFWPGKFSQICEPTHPRVFDRFGNTKGKVRVKKGHILEIFPPKKRFYFWMASLSSNS